MSRIARRFALVCAAGMALALGANAAAAQLPACSGTGGGGTKIVLDGFSARNEADAGRTAREMAERIHRAIRLELEGLRNTIPNAGLNPLVECDRRLPRQSSDFRSSVISELAGNGVIIEVWALVDSAVSLSGKSSLEVEIDWAIFPLCTFPEFGQHPQGFFSTPTRSFDFGESFDLDDLLGNESLFHAYALVGLGIHAVDEKRYDTAIAYLNGAACRLKDNDPGGITAYVTSIESMIRDQAAAEGVTLTTEALDLTDPVSCP